MHFSADTIAARWSGVAFLGTRDSFGKKNIWGKIKISPKNPGIHSGKYVPFPIGEGIEVSAV